MDIFKYIDAENGAKMPAGMIVSERNFFQTRVFVKNRP